MSESNLTVVGIDVSKAALDVAVRPEGQPRTFSNDEGGIQALVGRLKELKPSLIVLEATGGLEMPAVAALASHTLPVVVDNPQSA